MFPTSPAAHWGRYSHHYDPHHFFGHGYPHPAPSLTGAAGAVGAAEVAGATAAASAAQLGRAGAPPMSWHYYYGRGMRRGLGFRRFIWVRPAWHQLPTQTRRPGPFRDVLMSASSDWAWPLRHGTIRARNAPDRQASHFRPTRLPLRQSRRTTGDEGGKSTRGWLTTILRSRRTGRLLLWQGPRVLHP